MERALCRMLPGYVPACALRRSDVVSAAQHNGFPRKVGALLPSYGGRPQASLPLCLMVEPSGRCSKGLTDESLVEVRGDQMRWGFTRKSCGEISRLHKPTDSPE